MSSDLVSFLAGAVFISPVAIGVLICYLRRPGRDAGKPEDAG